MALIDRSPSHFMQKETALYWAYLELDSDNTYVEFLQNIVDNWDDHKSWMAYHRLSEELAIRELEIHK